MYIQFLFLTGMQGFIQDFFSVGGKIAKCDSMHEHAQARGVWGHVPPGKFDIYNL